MITPYDHTLCAREIRYAIAFGLDEEDASVQAASINIFLTATGQFLGPVFGAAMAESYGGAAPPAWRSHPPSHHCRLSPAWRRYTNRHTQPCSALRILAATTGRWLHLTESRIPCIAVPWTTTSMGLIGAALGLGMLAVLQILDMRTPLPSTADLC